jgi:hypothetical protein
MSVEVVKSSGDYAAQRVMAATARRLWVYSQGDSVRYSVASEVESGMGAEVGFKMRMNSRLQEMA